jgi:hypothetical protein
MIALAKVWSSAYEIGTSIVETSAERTTYVQFLRLGARNLGWIKGQLWAVFTIINWRRVWRRLLNCCCRRLLGGVENGKQPELTSRVWSPSHGKRRSNSLFSPYGTINFELDVRKFGSYSVLRTRGSHGKPSCQFLQLLSFYSLY